MRKRLWLVDAALIVLVTAMAALVVVRLGRLVRFWRDDSRLQQDSETRADEPMQLTPELNPDGEQDKPAVEDKSSTPGSSILVNTPTDDPSQLAETHDFSLENLSGESVSLSDFRGTPVVVNFWATWCPPCRAEMPILQAAAEAHPDDLVILAINSDETLSEVEPFVSAYNYSFEFLMDPAMVVLDQFQIRGFPTSLFFDQDGQLVATFIGELNENLLDYYLAQIGVLP